MQDARLIICAVWACPLAKHSSYAVPLDSPPSICCRHAEMQDAVWACPLAQHAVPLDSPPSICRQHIYYHDNVKLRQKAL